MEADGVGLRFILEEDRRRNGKIHELFTPTNGIRKLHVAIFMHRFKLTQNGAR
jgi:hypothetical protein